MAGAYSSAFSSAFDSGSNPGAAGGNTIAYSAPAVALLVSVLAGGNTVVYSAPVVALSGQVVAVGGNTITYAAPDVTARVLQIVEVGGNRVHYLAPSVAVTLTESDGAATRQAPNVWVECRITDTSDTVTTYRWSGGSHSALADPPTYYGGFKEARVVSGGWGDLVRELSSMEGQYSVGEWSVELDDTDGAIRALLADDATSHTLRWEVVVHFVSELGRKAGVTPRTLLRGRVIKAIPVAGRRVRLDVRDLLGADLRGFDLDTNLPLDTWGDDFTADDVPAAVKALPQQIVIGENSDLDAVDIDGNDVEKGTIPVFYGGRAFVGEDIAPAERRLAETPSGLVASVVGTPGTRRLTYGVVWVTYFGQTTAATVTVEDAPAVLNGTDYVALTWDGVEPAEYEDEIRSTRIFGRETDALISQLSIQDGMVTAYNDQGQHVPVPGRANTVNTAQVAPAGTPGAGGMFW